MVELYNLSRDKLIKMVDWYQRKYGPYIEKRGSHNWKNLFRKPTLYEWIIFAMLILALFIGWAYKHDIASYQTALYECENKYQIIFPSNEVSENITIKEESNYDNGIG